MSNNITSDYTSPWLILFLTISLTLEEPPTNLKTNDALNPPKKGPLAPLIPLASPGLFLFFQINKEKKKFDSLFSFLSPIFLCSGALHVLIYFELVFDLRH